jgi:L-ascorbate metabolism protein UlaG (beta-lactamase superfamily)
MHIRRYGHAALLVELDGTRILIDPGSYSSDEAFALSGLDAIVVTHQHADHVDPQRLATLLAGSPDALLLVEASCIASIPGLDARATALGHGQRVQVGPAVIRGVGSRHAVIHPDLPTVGNVGVTVGGAKGPTLFHPGDAYASVPDSVDVLAVPVSAPWARLSETVDFVRAVGASTVVPIHDAALTSTGYGVYRKTIEALGGPARYEWLDPAGALTVD